MVEIHIKDALRALIGRRRSGVDMPFEALPFKARVVPPGMRDRRNIAKLHSDLQRSQRGAAKCEAMLGERGIRKNLDRLNKVLSARAHFRQLEEHVKPILAAAGELHG